MRVTGYLGIVIWAVLLTVVCSATLQINNYVASWQEKVLENEENKLWANNKISEISYLLNPLDLHVTFPDWEAIRAGDKVYVEAPEGRTEIGVIYATQFYWEPKRYEVCVRIYKEYRSIIGSDSRFRVVKQPADSAWVIETLLPDQRRKELIAMAQEYFQNHWENSKEELLPIFTQMAEESYLTIQKNFSVVMDQHKDPLLGKLKELFKDSLEKELGPLWEKVVWPILVAQGEPVLDPILKELWKKFPKGKLVWLWVYQSLPYTEKNHVKKQVEQFIKEEAIPILENHQEDMQKLTVEILKKVGEDPEVRETLKAAMKKVFTDEKLLQLLKTVLLELFEINKKDLVQKFKDKWNSPEFQQQFTRVKSNFDQTLYRMINHLVLEENKYLREEFAEVLKRQILAKNKFCIVVTQGKQPLEGKNFTGTLPW